MNTSGMSYKSCLECRVSAFSLCLIESHISFMFSFGTESWLKKRWRTIRNDYRRITTYNLTHSKKIPMHKMANHLNFLTIDLNGANNMDFEDLKLPRKEAFHITKEMLDGCDINESITFDSISAPKVCDPNLVVETNDAPTNQNGPETGPVHSTKNATERSEKQKNHAQEETETNKIPDTRISNKNAEQRCEDEIFGEFIVAMLKKLPPEEKKRAKKEIMNILL